MDTKLRSLILATVPGKKDDPNYAVVRGHVPIDLYKQFKFFCVENSVDNSEGLEMLLRSYFGGETYQQSKLSASSITRDKDGER